MGLYLGGLIIGRIFASEIWGLIFGRAYFRGRVRGLSEFYGTSKAGPVMMNLCNY